MSVTDELDDAEIDERFNHWDENHVSHCKNCGSFVTKPEPENHKIRYTCEACGRAILEYVG